MRKISMLMIATVFLLLSSIHAQTTLNPGDLVIVNVNQDAPDNFDFIPLVDIQAGTVVKFTDNGLNTSNVLLATEGTLTWTASTAVTKGTVVSFSGTAGGDWVLTGTMALSNTGDNLLVYQGDAATPSFIYGIGWGKTNVWAYTGSNDSNIPAALSVAGKTIVTLGTSDNYQYNGPTSGTAAQLLAMVAYAPYWSVNDATPYPAYATAFTITATATCTAPYALTASGMTASSANLGWSTFGTEVLWNIEYGVTGFVQGAGTTVSGVTNPYTLNGLTQNTIYQYYVQADCGGSTSTWAGPFSFTTSCGAVTTFPHNETFATYLPSACWTEGDAGDLTAGPTTISSTASTWSVDGFLNSGTSGAAKINIDATVDNDWIISPEFSILATPTFRLKYSVGATQWNAITAPTTPWEADDFIEVLVTTSYPTNWTVLKTYNDLNTPSHLGQTDILDLSAYAGQNVRFAFRGVEGASDGSADIDFFIDNFVVEAVPSCEAPTALTATSITATGATLGWTAGGTETLWNVEYGVTGFVQGAGTTVSGVTNPYTLNGLTQNTIYQYYVQADCGGSTSTWAGPFSFTTPYSCPKPTLPTATNVTSTSADLSWTNGGTETAWIVYYKTAAATDYTEVTGVTTNPYTLNGLSAGTSYIFKVKANCSVSDTSFTSATQTFATTCNAVSTLPWVEGFETGYTDAAAIAGCWSQISTTGSAPWKANSTGTTYNRTPRTGTFNSTLYYGNEDWLFYPFSLTAGTNYTFEMYARQDGSTTANANITVAYGANADVASMTNSIIASTGLTNGNYQLLSGAFTPATSGIYYIGIKGFINSSPWYISIDDIKLDLTPACVAPTALNATSITASGATLGWTAGGTETTWNIEYGVTGFTQGTGTIANGVSNAYAITGLTQNTTYQFYVQADCGGSGISTWSGPVSFTTAYSCPKPTLPTVSNVTTVSADLAWTAGGTETSWIVYYKTVAATSFTEVLNVTTNPYTLSGLASGTNYIFKVKASCSVSDTSVMSNTQTFTTTCAAITALPYVEPFATYLPSVCWLEGDAGDLTAGPTTISATAAAWNADGFLNNGSTGAARINVYGTTHNDWLISPEITIPAGSHRLKYSVGATQYGDVIAPTTPWESDDVVQVLVSTTHPANWTVLKTYDNTNVPSYLGQDDMIDLAAYSGQTIRIAYRALMGSTNSSSDIDFFVDNFTVEAVPSCEAPLSLTANAITSNSADIAFTSAAPNFNVRYRLAGATTWTTTTATASPVSITGLTHSSQYEVQIMAFCSATDSSAWSSVVNFSTLCGVYQVPFLQDFNVAPNCWTLSSDTLNSSIDLSGTTSSWGLASYLNIASGQLAARLNIYGSSMNSWLLSPEINLGTGANQLEFDLAATEYNDITDASGTRVDDKFAVVISTDGGITWSQANVLRQWDNTGSTYVYNNINATPQHITIDLSAYSGVVKLAFYGESFVSGNGDNDLFVDNVAVNPILAPCATPTALAATNVAQTTADLGWTSTAANFNVRYRTVGATTWTAATATTTTLALTALTENTQYEFQVQAVCSATAGDTSAWATAVNFTTLATPACATPTALAATNIAQTTADLGWTSTAANFNVRYRTVGATVWTAATATTTTLALTALTANTQYEFQVQAVCSATAGDTSAWATAVNFTTLDITPTCDAPTALVVSAINAAGASLSWTNGGTETAWNIRYKKVADATYTNVNNTTTKPYVLTGLQANTAYVWNIQAICSGTLNSAWSVDNTFTTTVGVEDNSLNGLSVYSYNKEVNVINNGNILVKAVVIYDMLGQEVGTYAINSTDNVLINSNLTIGNYVVKVITETKVGNYKLFIK